MPNPSILDRLRDRKVVQYMLAYIAAAWVIAQVAEVVAEPWSLPLAWIRVLHVLLVAGFPMTVTLAWFHGDRGHQRVTRSEAALLAIVLGGTLLGVYSVDLTETSSVDAPQHAGIESVRNENSIAVLPFVNMSSDEEQEYFSDGLSEELLNLLAKVPELSVAARTSSFSFKGKDIEIPEIAARLKVTHVLEGSVRKHGNQIRITAQLIRADEGFHLWSETYDRQLDDVFQIQDDIAGAVVDALKIQLLGEAPRARRTDTEAYQAFLEGQYLKRQLSPESLDQAVAAFKQAVAIDPEFAPAWAELADTYFWGGRGWTGMSREERTALADEAIHKAISLDPDYAYAYYVRGISGFYSRHLFRQGMADFRHALELEPENAILIAAIGKGALLSGNHELAISQYEAALALESLVPEFYRFIGLAYLDAGRFEKAEASFRTLSRLSPDYHWEWLLWQALFLKGDLEAALELSVTNLRRAVVFHALGDAAKAAENLAEMVKEVRPDSDDSLSVALAYGFRGEADQAFDWLDRLDVEAYFPTHILFEAGFQGLHSDPRWKTYLEKLGLLEVWLESTSG